MREARQVLPQVEVQLVRGALLRGLLGGRGVRARMRADRAARREAPRVRRARVALQRVHRRRQVVLLAQLLRVRARVTLSGAPGQTERLRRDLDFANPLNLIILHLLQYIREQIGTD